MDYREGNKEYLNIERTPSGFSYVELEATQTAEYYRQAYDFVNNCEGNINILSKGLMGTATSETFLRSEELIEEIIQEINPEWNTKQKAAYVHYKMGELVSYMPDCTFNNKVGKTTAKDARSIWTSIDNGISVCNGITTIQRNILSRIGINTKELSSGTHSFVLIKTEEGNIISDPTWDLTNTLFQGRPMYFGKTYEQLREIDGPLSKAHRLENPLDNVIEVSEEELREIYKSIGVAKEDGSFKFPILDKVNEINNQQYENESDKVQAFLQMFSQNFSKQATHLTETRTMIERCILALGIDDKSFTTKFVYSKEDETSEKPYLCMHFNSEEMKDNIVILNNEEMKFENLSLKDFDDLYKPHEEDTREPFWNKYLQRDDVSRKKEQDRTIE